MLQTVSLLSSTAWAGPQPSAAKFGPSVVAEPPEVSDAQSRRNGLKSFTIVAPPSTLSAVVGCAYPAFDA